MLTERAGQIGFVSTVAGRKAVTRRSRALELVATAALALALVVAMTAVSIGIARADALGVNAQGDPAPLALAVFLGLLLAGMGGLTALAVRRPARRK
jgi:hypothetical protein